MQDVVRTGMGLIVAIALLTVPLVARAAELRDHSGSEPCQTRALLTEVCFFEADFTGTIEHGDEIKVEQFIAQKRAEHPHNQYPLQFSFSFDSAGGDVATALKIGRSLRDADAKVEVWPRSFCASSCVLILAAGVDRRIDGQVLIHRPYFTALDSSLSSQKIDVLFKTMKQQIGDYLEEMNVPRSLADAMMAIPPEEGHVLSAAELHQYMLDQKDPGYEEKWTAFLASSYGVSSAEYRKRDDIAKRNCNTLLEPLFLACNEGVRLGISPNLYTERDKTWEHIIADPSFHSLTYEARSACYLAVFQRGASVCP